MIHFDMHGGNFFVDGTGSINLFDFDDCHYSWFAYDVAISLFYVVMGAENEAESALDFLRNFIIGYQIENQFRAEWLKQIPVFLKMREIDLYAIIHRSFDLDTTDDKWVLWYMDGRKEKIEGDVPYVNADFTMLAKMLHGRN